MSAGPRHLALAALLLAAAGAAGAQGYDPDFHWQTLDTPHFQLHYHQGLEPLAQRLARLAEAAHARLVPVLGYAPRQRTQLVLSDDTDQANGSATPLPYNTIRLFAVPAESASVLENEPDWLDGLITHEYVHILHLDHVGGLPAFLNAIFGKLFVPNGLTPGWMIEGIAVTHEAEGHPGGGRNESALFDMYARALVVEPPGLPSLAQASNNFYEWPRGNVPYLLGGRFMAWLEQTRGGDAMRGFLADQGSQIWPWAPSFQTETWFHADLPTLWAEFREALQARYQRQLAEIRRRPVTRPVPLTRRGGQIDHPRWTPDGSAVVYSDRGLDERAGLRRVAPDGRDLGLSTPVELDGTFALASPRQAVVAKGQVWHEFRIYTDLHLVDLETGADQVLTDGERATDPDLTPDGKSVVYVARTGAGELAIRRRPLAGGPAETLLARPGVQVYEPRVSPDGTRIALSIQEGGRRDLALLQDGILTRLTDDDDLDLSPAWSPDGRWLLFASSRGGGVLNLFALEVATGRLRQVTNLETGALQPAVSPDGRTLAFATYSRAGFDLATLPFEPGTWFDPQPPPPPDPGASLEEPARRREAVPAPLPQAALPAGPLRSRPYAVEETLGPTFWLPTIGSDAAGTTFGAFTGGQDAVALNTWLAQAWYSPKAVTAGYAATYLGAWSWPSVDLLSERLVDSSPGWPPRLLSAWTPLAGGLTFTFTRLERAFALRLGWSATRYDTISEATSLPTPLGASTFQDGLLSEPTFAAAYTDARRYSRSISPEEGRDLSFRARWAGPASGSDYRLWRMRASWAEFLRVPFTQHAVLATRLSGGLAQGTLGGQVPFSLGGESSPDLLSLAALQSFSPSDQLRGYPPGLFGGNGVALLNVELRFPIAAPQWGHSTWPLFLRRVHGALFADAGETFVHGNDFGPGYPDFQWKRLRVGAGAELRLETVFGYWLTTDVRIGVARGLGKPLGGLSPTADPYAEWRFYVVMGPSF